MIPESLSAKQFFCFKNSPAHHVFVCAKLDLFDFKRRFLCTTCINQPICGLRNQGNQLNNRSPKGAATPKRGDFGGANRIKFLFRLFA